MVPDRSQSFQEHLPYFYVFSFPTCVLADLEQHSGTPDFTHLIYITLFQRPFSFPSQSKLPFFFVLLSSFSFPPFLSLLCSIENLPHAGRGQSWASINRVSWRKQEPGCIVKFHGTCSMACFYNQLPREDVQEDVFGTRSGNLRWNSWCRAGQGSLRRERETSFILGHRGVFNFDWMFLVSEPCLSA